MPSTRISNTRRIPTSTRRGANGLAALDFSAPFRPGRHRAGHKRICLQAVIDDDERAVAGERSGIDDRTVVNRTNGRALLRRELYAALPGRAGDTRAAASERIHQAAGDGPVEIAAKGANRQRRAVHGRPGRAGVNRAQRLLQFDLSGLELAGQLCHEIAALVVRDDCERDVAGAIGAARASDADCCSFAISARSFSRRVRAPTSQILRVCSARFDRWCTAATTGGTSDISG